MLAALSHLLLDYTTAYGIRLFEPFNFRWYSWDIVYIVDPLIWLVLIAGLALPSLFGLINQEIGARSQGPRGRARRHHRAGLPGHDLGRARLSAPPRAQRDELFPLPRRAAPAAAAYPYMVNPFRWHGVVETQDFFETVPVNSLTPDVEADGGQLFYKPPVTPALQAAKASYLGRVYLDWAAFPFTREEKLDDEGGGFLVNFEDLRYDYPSNSRRAPLGAFVLLNPELQVLEQGMNSSRPASLTRLQQSSDNP